jgi:4-hydroxybenzoate polyprenyltransferase
MNGALIFRQTKGVLRLTRWLEHIPFVGLTLWGALLANSLHNAAMDWRLLAIAAANFLTVCYAFMINDIEDAPDDAQDAERAKRNPITSGELSVTAAYIACAIFGAAALLLYVTGGVEVLLVGGLNLLLSHLYSWRVVRLKSIPILDVISHSSMLGGLLLISGYLIYYKVLDAAWLVALACTFGSVYGQLYNQLRDYDMDKAAGIHNTAITMGQKITYILMYASVALVFVCVLLAIIQGAFPVWLTAAIVISLVVSMFFKPKTDMRGGEAVDITGALQIQFWIAFNSFIVIWLIGVLLSQFSVI